MASSRLSRLRENECRSIARSVLEKFHVSSAADIDVESIAWHQGRLRIRVGGLTSCEKEARSHTTRRRDPSCLETQLGKIPFYCGSRAGSNNFLTHVISTIRISKKADLTVWNDAS